MKIAYRLRNMGWMPENVTTIDSLFNPENWPKTVFVARNQGEYDTLRGYQLVYGRKISLVLEGDHEAAVRGRNAILVFLWVDFPNNPD